jgi:hypothetical protein
MKSCHSYAVVTLLSGIMGWGVAPATAGFGGISSLSIIYPTISRPAWLWAGHGAWTDALVAPSLVIPTATATPTRPQFTRSGGMPGAPREIAPAEAAEVKAAPVKSKRRRLQQTRLPASE